MMKNDRQIDLIEDTIRNAYLTGKTPEEIPAVWQSNVMASLKREINAEKNAVSRTETTMFHVSWIAAGIAAVLVLIFGLFFNTADNDGSLEDDLQNLYVDNSMIDMFSANLQ